MKLMIVGSDMVYSIENFYVKYLREAGVDVLHFPAQRFFYNYYQKNILNKLMHRTGLSGIIININELFKTETLKFLPDVIWVFKGMEILPSSLQWARDRSIKLVNYNGDNPFLFSGKGSGNAFVTDSINLYDLHLTYNKEVEKEMFNRRIPVSIIPFGYDLDDKLYLECCKEKEINKVCFLGNPDKFRGIFLQSLAEEGIQIDLYGNGWDRFVKHTNVSTFKPVYSDNAWRTLRKYRVQLNLMRPHNPDAHNMRTFELGGVGAIQLAADTPDHREYFVANKEIFLFKTKKECVEKIHVIRNMDEQSADNVRIAVRKRSIDSGYSYKQRALQALQEINKIA